TILFFKKVAFAPIFQYQSCSRSTSTSNVNSKPLLDIVPIFLVIEETAEPVEVEPEDNGKLTSKCKFCERLSKYSMLKFNLLKARPSKATPTEEDVSQIKSSAAFCDLYSAAIFAFCAMLYNA